jgi:uncharacterized protein (DUF2141 family)
MRTLLFPLVLGLALATGASAQSSGKLSVSVTGVRNDSGSVRCGLYSSADGFREPGREMRGAVAPIKNGQATCVFSAVPAGTYAVAVFHAEHNETQMETGLFGKPKQGYGSRTIHPRPSGRRASPAPPFPIRAGRSTFRCS